MIKHLALLFFLLIFKSAIAQIVEDTTVRELREVKLVGKKYFVNSSNVSSVSVSKETIENTNAENVAEALQTVPGVVVKDYGGIGGLKTVSMRGLGAEHTVILFDNIKMSDVQTGQVDLGRLSVQNLEEIQVYKGHPRKEGQTATAYTGAATINIVTSRRIQDTAGKFEAGIAAGSFAYFSPFAVFSKPIRKSIFVLDAVARISEGKYPFEYKNGDSLIKSERENSDLKDIRLTADYSVKAGDMTTLSFKGFYNAGERGLPGAVVFYSVHSQARLNQSDKFLQLETDHKFTENSGVKYYAKYSHSYLRYYDPLFLNSKGFLENKYIQHEYFTSLAGYRNYNYLKVNAAADLILNDLNSPDWTINHPSRITVPAVVSLSFINKGFQVDADVLNTFISDKSEIISRTKDVLTPAFGAGYVFPSKIISINATYKKAFRMPTFNDLYYNLSGNTKLKPEFSENYNLSVSCRKDKLFITDYTILKADFFYLNIKDKIVAIPTQNLFVWSMRNLGLVHTSGMEIYAETSFLLGKKVRSDLNFSYTYQSAKDVTDPRSTVYKNQIPYTPWETVSSTAGVHVMKMKIAYSFIYTGYRYALGENIPFNFLDSYAIHDASISYDFKIAKNNLKLKFEVNNLTDLQYHVIKSFPMPGRMFKIKLEFKYA